MKMKNILLLLSALVVVPAWAGDAAVAPSTTQSTLQATQTAPETKTECGSSFLIKEACAKELPGAAASKGVAPLGCPTGCSLMNCPQPGGPVVCCKNNVPC